jgi:hypothetical protein
MEDDLEALGFGFGGGWSLGLARALEKSLERLRWQELQPCGYAIADLQLRFATTSVLMRVIYST